MISIGHLSDHTERFPLSVEAIEEADRIEDVASDSTKRKQLDGTAFWKSDVVFRKVANDVRFGIRRTFVQVVLIIEGIEIEAISTEEPESLRRGVKCVEVEPEVENAISKMMLFGREAVVHHVAFIEPIFRCLHQGSPPRISVQRFTAEPKASS